jgi:hypothetical protein
MGVNFMKIMSWKIKRRYHEILVILDIIIILILVFIIITFIILLQKEEVEHLLFL